MSLTVIRVCNYHTVIIMLLHTILIIIIIITCIIIVTICSDICNKMISNHPLNVHGSRQNISYTKFNFFKETHQWGSTLDTMVIKTILHFWLAHKVCNLICKKVNRNNLIYKKRYDPQNQLVVNLLCKKWRVWSTLEGLPSEWKNFLTSRILFVSNRSRLTNLTLVNPRRLARIEVREFSNFRIRSYPPRRVRKKIERSRNSAELITTGVD